MSQDTQGLDRTEASTPAPDDPSKPDAPTDLQKRTWFYIARKVRREFAEDQCTDMAAALTYYGVLALFPAAIALSAILGLVGQAPEKSVQTVLDVLSPLVSEDTLGTIKESAAGAGQLAVGRPGARARPPRRAVVGVGVRRRVRPRHEPHLRDRRGSPVLEAAARHAADHPGRDRAGRAGDGDAGRQRAVGPVDRRPDRPRRPGGPGLEHRQVAGDGGSRHADRGDPLLRHAERAAAQVPLDLDRRGGGHPDLDRGLGRLRLLRRELLLLQQDLRLAGRRRRRPGVPVADERRAPAGRRDRLRARARPSAPGRHRGRDRAPAARARHSQHREGGEEGGRGRGQGPAAPRGRRAAAR